MTPPSLTVAVGVLVAPLAPEPPPPDQLPIGRAALSLAAEGIDVLFGNEADAGEFVGVRARLTGWTRAVARVDAVYDRFPSQQLAGQHQRLLAALAGIPVGNAPKVVALCRDKLATQRLLEATGVSMPPVEADPARFSARLAEWGAAFVKPRHGAFGRGVRRVERGEVPPASVDGTLANDDALLQRAIDPPLGWAGQCVRALLQREAAGWRVVNPVLRQSRTDPVANAARGAEVIDVELERPDLLRAVEQAALQVAAAFSDPLAIELGVDFALDAEGVPWPIEVNGTPRGRLEVLATRDRLRWGSVQHDACCRPLRYLAQLVTRTS